MSLASKTLKLCSCNGTIALDPKRLAEALKMKQPVAVHRELCRKEAGAFQASLADPDLIVACTQEAPLFAELAAAAQSQARISFVNIRETAGWSAEGKDGGTEDRGAARGGGAAGARAGAAGGLQVGRPAADHRAGRRGARLGGAARGHAGGERAADRQGHGRAARPSAAIRSGRAR